MRAPTPRSCRSPASSSRRMCCAPSALGRGCLPRGRGRTQLQRGRVRDAKAMRSARNATGRGDASAVVGDELPPPPPPASASTPVRTPPIRDCAIRLLNVLFSDEFAHRLRGELQDASSSSDSEDEPQQRSVGSFWQDVQRAFTSDSPTFDVLVVTHECVRDVDPSTVVTPGGNDAATLRSMWKDVKQRHQRACTVMISWVASLQGAPLDFFAFCLGHTDAFYLHCWLQRRPDLVGSVVTGRVLLPATTTGPTIVVGATQVPSVRPAPGTEAPSFARHSGRLEEEEPGEEGRTSMLEVAIPSTTAAPPPPPPPPLSWADRVEQERATTQTQKQLVEVVDCIERLRAELCQYAPGSVAYREISDEFYWFQSRKRRLRARLEQ